MTIKTHASLLAYSFITWLSFYLLGLPEYYQQWYVEAKLLILPLVTVMYFPVTRLNFGVMINILLIRVGLHFI